MRESKFINAADKIFVAGHRGMVGKAVYRQLLKKGYKNLITCERKKLDLEVYSQVHDYIKTNKPTVVVLCAAKVGGILANNNYPADIQKINRLAGRQTDRQAGRDTDRQADGQTERQTDKTARSTDRHADSQTHSQMDRMC